jgi:membrane-associated phospholipid phosphatase
MNRKPGLLKLGAVAILLAPGVYADDPSTTSPTTASTIDPLLEDDSFAFRLPYQEDSGSHKYLEWLWKDPVNLVTRPMYWHDKDWGAFGIEAGITVALMPVDDNVRDLVLDHPSAGRDSVLDAFRTISGDGANYLLAGAVLFGSGLYVHNEKLADAGFLTFESAAYAGALATVLKALTGRERPADADNQYQFNGPGSGSSNSSFVSGEAATAFAFASSISEVYQNPWITWPAYILATGVSLQRINDNRHWLSDVVGAAFLGHAVGKSIVRFHYRRDSNGVLQPYFTGDAIGVQMSYKF